MNDYHQHKQVDCNCAECAARNIGSSAYHQRFREKLNGNKIKPNYHGQFGTPIYTAWSNMIQRTRNPNNVNYHQYGGRGITVCERWQDFKCFHEDMLPTWEKYKTLDRIDVNGNYEPSNCRWATMGEQANNKRTNVRYEYEGKSLNMTQWAQEKGLPYRTLRDRLRKLDWSIEKALTTPVDLGNRYNRSRGEDNQLPEEQK